MMGPMTPMTATLPFNRDCIGQTFEPAKRGGALPTMAATSCA